MVGHILTLGAVVALAQAKAIVSNQCSHNVYLWSVPDIRGVANALPIGSGERYDEPWRAGTSVNPGIAIKVSSHPNGINDDKEEIDYEYVVEHNKVWIGLSGVRGTIGNNTVFFTCHGPSKTPNVPTQQCSITDDVELVLCGTERTGPAEDTTHPNVIDQCSCPVIQRDEKKTPRRPRLCNARVISPPRTPQLNSTARADKTKKEKKTVPLKTVLQSDCPWAPSTGNCPHNQTTTRGDDPWEEFKAKAEEEACELAEATGIQNNKCDKRKKNTLNVHNELAGIEKCHFCDPDDKTCDERTARFVAMLGYVLCEQHDMFKEDADAAHECSRITSEMKRICPNIGKPNQVLQRSRPKKEKIYIASMCKKFVPQTKCGKIEKLLEQTNPWYDFDDSTTDDDEHYIEQSATNTTKEVDQLSIPLGAVCRNFMPGVNCEDVEEFLEERNKHFDFVDDEEQPIDKNPAVQSANKTSAQQKPYGRKTTNIQARKPQKPFVCVNTFCYQHREASCHEIKKAFEMVHPENDYTTDDDKGCWTDKV